MARTSYPEKNYIGIDNGVSGSIGVVSLTGQHSKFLPTPVFSCLNYTKDVRNLNRIDHTHLEFVLKQVTGAVAVIERPMVNPTRFQASASALRALESTLVVLERLSIPYQFVDSKQWQKDMLPNGVKGEALKTASLDVGKRLFPQFSALFKGDADGILIAEWARRKLL